VVYSAFESYTDDPPKVAPVELMIELGFLEPCYVTEWTSSTINSNIALSDSLKRTLLPQSRRAFLRNCQFLHRVQNRDAIAFSFLNILGPPAETPPPDEGLKYSKKKKRWRRDFGLGGGTDNFAKKLGGSAGVGYALKSHLKRYSNW
jgi:hypothetical protein